MRKVLYGLALLAPLPLAAQTTPYRGQSGFDVGPVINCVALDGSGAARCLVPSVALLDANGAPFGTATNPIYVSGGGTAGGATSANQTNGNAVTRVTSAGTSGLAAAVTSGAQAPLWLGTRGQTILGGYNTNFASASPFGGTIAALLTSNDQIASLAVSPLVYNLTTGANNYVPGDATGAWTTSRGAPNLNTNQVSVGTTATLVSASRLSGGATSPRSRLIVTQSAAGPCYYGPANTVSATTGSRLTVAGASKTYNYSGALYGICPGGAVTVDVDEEY